VRVLGVDTATATCSVGIIDAGGIIHERYVEGGRSHSIHLLSLIQSALVSARLEMTDIEGFGVTIGPGSFTGLRIGIGVVKGLAFALNRPAAGVSSLEALVHPFRHEQGLVCPMLDARKGEVYFSFYRAGPHGFSPRGEEAVGPVEEALAEATGACLFVGDGARLYRERITAALGERAGFAAAGRDRIRASSVAELARSRLLQDPFDDAGRLVARYVRRPDAREPRSTLAPA
jgi:tRNA threonylcarbamoyladenosine biosynthesis protein TsaB